MMQQYREAKRLCPGALLLFRMGDFYELFDDDARLAARVLNLTLTSREKGENARPMAGFPHHQLEGYLGRMIAARMRVAICEQVEDPKQAKGLVRREVTRVVSAGTLTDDALLDPRESNYLAAIVPGDAAGIAWLDLSTGRFFAAMVAGAQLSDELARIGPVECLISEAAKPPAADGTLVWTTRPPWAFSPMAASEALTRQFGTANLEGFGFGDEDLSTIGAAGAILDYLAETQKCGLAHLDRLVRYRAGAAMEIDEATRRSLELARTLRDGRRDGSLLGVLDRTVTAMGSRLLADRLANPLTDIAEIDARLDGVAELVAAPSLTRDLRDSLTKVYDMERLLGRVTTGRASPRDLSFLGRTLALVPQIKAKLTGRTSELLARLEDELDLCAEVRAKIEAALEDDCPLVSHDGGFIRDGYDHQLDALRELARGGKQWIAAYQSQEADRSGIPNLKVGFNKVFGYYLEVTNSHRQKVPDDYIRKQTVKNSERYVTPQLKEYEEKVLSADEHAKELEHKLFVELRDFAASEVRRLQRTASVLAQLDVLAALAHLAADRGYVRPKMVDEPLLSIADSRHPVLDCVLPPGTFVPNAVEAGADERRLLLITGPNMAGKSTYIRQVALTCIMAQLGSFVPASRATLGVVDRVFARVGASDELTRGQSTFMVEMTETARILHNATRRSLVILDEIGRGTSTYDGVSLAWAVAEHLHDRVGCRTFFATHYHELADLVRSLPAAANLNASVREWEDKIVFLHKIAEGPADKSYGIQVARLAGVPPEVIDRAKAVLAQLEEDHLDAEGGPKLARRAVRRTSPLQLTLFAAQDHPVLDDVRASDVDHLTPLEALGLIRRWQEQLNEFQVGKPR